MSKAKKLGLIGTGVAFCLALFMSAFAYYNNSHHLAYPSLLYLCLAPTSIVLIVTEWATPSAVAIIVLIFALSNAFIYGVVFLEIGKIWDGLNVNTR